MSDSKPTPNPQTAIRLRRRAQTPLPPGRTLYDQPEEEIEFTGEEAPDEVIDSVAKPEVQPAVAAVAVPSPQPAAPKRKVVVVENPQAPEVKKKVTVAVTNLAPASPVERVWVVSGANVNVPIIKSDPKTGKPIRLVAVYLAFRVTDVQEDNLGNRKVTGIVRWHNLPTDRERKWHQKLQYNESERLNQLVEALEYFFAFSEARPGMAVQLFAAPATNRETMRRGGFHYFSGKAGDPAIKVQINVAGAEAPYTAAKVFYENVNPYWLPNFLKLEWPFFDITAVRRYRLGREVAQKGIPQLQDDGLTPVQRVGMLGLVAVLAGETMASLFKVAFRGDRQAESLMINRLHHLPSRTVMGTVFEDQMR